MVVGLLTGVVRYQGVVGPPPSIAPTLLKLDIGAALTPAMLPVKRSSPMRPAPSPARRSARPRLRLISRGAPACQLAAGPGWRRC
jgi:hypothetical protein